MILCARSTSTSSGEQSTKRRSRSESMRKVCLFYSQSSKILDYQTWPTHLFEKFMTCAKVCGLFSWLCFTDADWLGRQTPITWLSLLLNCSSVKGSHDWSCSYCQFFRFISAKKGLEVDIKVGNRTCWQKDNRIRFLEHVEIQLSLRFRRQGSLQVFLTSPRGTKSNMIPKRKYDRFPALFSNFTVDSVQFWGEDPLGTWKLGFRNFNPDLYYTGKGIVTQVCHLFLSCLLVLLRSRCIKCFNAITAFKP